MPEVDSDSIRRAATKVVKTLKVAFDSEPEDDNLTSPFGTNLESMSNDARNDALKAAPGAVWR